MPTTSPQDRPIHNPYLNDPDRPIYVVCYLMQQLPADITNAGPLTQGQSLMAEAVAYFADVTHETVLGGLAEIGKLMSDVTSNYADSMPHLGRLIQHLSVEAQFMQEAAANYRDAAMGLCCGLIMLDTSIGG
jgi:hypothetical protein